MAHRHITPGQQVAGSEPWRIKAGRFKGVGNRSRFGRKTSTRFNVDVGWFTPGVGFGTRRARRVKRYL